MSVEFTKKPWADLLRKHMSVYSTHKIFAVHKVGELPETSLMQPSIQPMWANPSIYNLGFAGTF